MQNEHSTKDYMHKLSIKSATSKEEQLNPSYQKVESLAEIVLRGQIRSFNTLQYFSVSLAKYSKKLHGGQPWHSSNFPTKEPS